LLKKLVGELSGIRQSFKREKPFKLKELSSQLIEEASLNNDYFKALMAVIAYSLFKLSSKGHIRKSPKWRPAQDEIIAHLDNAIALLGEKKFNEAEQELHNAVDKISRIDSEISNYAKGIFEKAKTKMASSAYSFGLSLGQAAYLTGADRKELMNYIGITKMHEEAGVSIGISERLNSLREEIS